MSAKRILGVGLFAVSPDTSVVRWCPHVAQCKRGVGIALSSVAVSKSQSVKGRAGGVWDISTHMLPCTLLQCVMNPVDRDENKVLEDTYWLKPVEDLDKGVTQSLDCGVTL